VVVGRDTDIEVAEVVIGADEAVVVVPHVDTGLDSDDAVPQIGEPLDGALEPPAEGDSGRADPAKAERGADVHVAGGEGRDASRLLLGAGNCGGGAERK